MNSCESCRYWSDRVASVEAGEPLQAVCLAPAGAVFAGQFVTGRQSCDAHADGLPIDAPEVAGER